MRSGESEAAFSEVPALTVSEVTRHVKALLDDDERLSDLWVRGEVSNFTLHSSGHMYFTLKDAFSQLRCVMFRRENAALTFRPQEGARVIARGRVSVFEKRGEYQLYVTAMQFDGVGALYEAFLRLRQKLEAEGLFAPERKRPLPRFPKRIAVVTSPTGAAVRDILNILRRRAPWVSVLVVPAQVQGVEAPESLLTALDRANRVEDIDLILLGRGGGSLEDLWAFNDERLARAVAASRHPVISAVGHETDFSLTDFAADLRAPTPSAAAELAVPDVAELGLRAKRLGAALTAALGRKAELSRQRLRTLTTRRCFTHPTERLAQWRQQVDDIATRGRNTVVSFLKAKGQALSRLEAKLSALDPRAVLHRGYAILLKAATDEVVTTVTQLAVGDEGRVVLQDGAADLRVLALHEEAIV